MNNHISFLGNEIQGAPIIHRTQHHPSNTQHLQNQTSRKTAAKDFKNVNQA